jgi:hypothetical protein
MGKRISTIRDSQICTVDYGHIPENVFYLVFFHFISLRATSYWLLLVLKRHTTDGPSGFPFGLFLTAFLLGEVEELLHSVLGRYGLHDFHQPFGQTHALELGPLDFHELSGNPDYLTHVIAVRLLGLLVDEKTNHISLCHLVTMMQLVHDSLLPFLIYISCSASL